MNAVVRQEVKGVGAPGRAAYGRREIAEREVVARLAGDTRSRLGER